MSRTAKILTIVCALWLSACGSADMVSAPQGHSTYSPPAVGGQMRVKQANFIAADTESLDEGESTAVSKEVSKQKSESTPSQLLVRNAWLTLEMDDEDDFPNAIQQIASQAKAMDGYVSVEGHRSITVRIPSQRLDEMLQSLNGLGELTDQNIRVTDVTANYVDLKVRIDNLTKLKARLQELILQGQNVKEVLEVEKELARVTSELEQLEGQMRLMKNQISYATVSVSLDTSVSPGPVGWVFYGVYTGVKWLFVWD